MLGKVEAKHAEQNRTEERNKRKEVKAKRVVYLLGKKRKENSKFLIAWRGTFP